MTDSAPEAETVTEGTIRVVRRHRPWSDRVRKYKVLVDDNEVGSVGDGKALDVQAAAGSHIVRLAIDWTGSADLAIEVKPAHVTYVYCSARFALTALFRLYGRSRWVDLRATPYDA